MPTSHEIKTTKELLFLESLIKRVDYFENEDLRPLQTMAKKILETGECSLKERQEVAQRWIMALMKNINVSSSNSRYLRPHSAISMVTKQSSKLSCKNAAEIAESALLSLMELTEPRQELIISLATSMYYDEKSALLGKIDKDTIAYAGGGEGGSGSASSGSDAKPKSLTTMKLEAIDKIVVMFEDADGAEELNYKPALVNSQITALNSSLKLLNKLEQLSYSDLGSLSELQLLYQQNQEDIARLKQSLAEAKTNLNEILAGLKDYKLRKDSDKLIALKAKIALALEQAENIKVKLLKVEKKHTSIYPQKLAEARELEAKKSASLREKSAKIIAQNEKEKSMPLKLLTLLAYEINVDNWPLLALKRLIQLQVLSYDIPLQQRQKNALNILHKIDLALKKQGVKLSELTVTLNANFNPVGARFSQNHHEFPKRMLAIARDLGADRTIGLATAVITNFFDFDKSWQEFHASFRKPKDQQSLALYSGLLNAYATIKDAGANAKFDILDFNKYKNVYENITTIQRQLLALYETGDSSVEAATLLQASNLLKQKIIEDLLAFKDLKPKSALKLLELWDYCCATPSNQDDIAAIAYRLLKSDNHESVLAIIDGLASPSRASSAKPTSPAKKVVARVAPTKSEGKAEIPQDKVTIDGILNVTKVPGGDAHIIASNIDLVSELLKETRNLSKVRMSGIDKHPRKDEFYARFGGRRAYRKMLVKVSAALNGTRKPKR